jgi:hypothetical protein
MATGFMAAHGVPPGSLAVMDSYFARKMQAPNSGNARALLKDLDAGFDVTNKWSASLAYSPPAYKKRVSIGGGRLLCTFCKDKLLFSGQELNSVLDRFVSVRHTFAHQDSSKGILSNKELQNGSARSGAGLPPRQNKSTLLRGSLRSVPSLSTNRVQL